jgi:hypothetical protein
MTLRSAHGRAKELGSIAAVEVSPADELPVGVPAPARPVALRDASGRLLPGAGTSALAREGAKAAHESRQLAALLGLWTPPEDHAFASYARLAKEWRDAHIAELGATVGGGEVGPGPASVISTAALELGASRWLFDQGAKEGNAKMLLEASRLADSSRQNVLAGHELAAREAVARGAGGGQPASNSLIEAIRDAASRSAPRSPTEEAR